MAEPLPEQHFSPSRFRQYLAIARSSPQTMREMIAKRRAERGLAWIMDKARNGYTQRNWARNLFQNGRFRAKDSYAEECVLALAFEWMPELAQTKGPTYGFVTFASVAEFFGLSGAACRRMGFQCDPGSGRLEVRSVELDAAWKKVLSQHEIYPPTPFRHAP